MTSQERQFFDNIIFNVVPTSMDVIVKKARASPMILLMFIKFMTKCKQKCHHAHIFNRISLNSKQIKLHTSTQFLQKRFNLAISLYYAFQVDISSLYWSYNFTPRSKETSNCKVVMSVPFINVGHVSNTTLVAIALLFHVYYFRLTFCVCIVCHVVSCPCLLEFSPLQLYSCPDNLESSLVACILSSNQKR